MSGNLVELAQRFVRLSGELDLTHDAMRRRLLNGAGGRKQKTLRRPSGPARSGRSRATRRRFGRLRSKTILKLLQSSPGMGTAAIAKVMAAQRSTTDERLKRLQAKGLIERAGPAPA